MFIELAAIAGAMHIGGKLGERYLSANDELPMCTETLHDAALTITRVRYRGKSWCRLYVATEGQSAMVMQGDYPELIAALQTWGDYLEGGGTVAAWLAQNAQRAAEVTRLEQSL
jgi:hypothetical protein